jgi:hypothetical protein
MKSKTQVLTTFLAIIAIIPYVQAGPQSSGSSIGSSAQSIIAAPLSSAGSVGSGVLSLLSTPQSSAGSFGSSAQSNSVPQSSAGSSSTSAESYDPTIRLYLDVGNDTDYEWAGAGGFVGPERIDLTDSINRYVRGGCWCVGCKLDSTNNCTVPIVFKANRGGNLTINDVNLTFSITRTIGEVGYGNSFRNSDGGCWSVEYYTFPGTATTPAPLPVPPDYTCSPLPPPPQPFTYPISATPFVTDDAINDAMYRLLSGPLSDDGDPTKPMNVTYNTNMTFEAEGKIGVQTLWGPVKMRLIIWS